MRIGIHTLFTGAETEPLPEYMRGVGRELENLGVDSVWIGEHVVTFKHYDSQFRYPYADDGVAPALFGETGIVDPISALTALAMTTETLRLGTGMAILPQRNPVYFAKMCTAIDLLSRGRMMVGVGVGWSGQESEAVDVPFSGRGKRMDEYIAILRALWTQAEPSFMGDTYQLPACVQLPRPAQAGGPPIVIGGESEVALRRAARDGDAWFGYQLRPEDLKTRLLRLDAELADLQDSRDRPEVMVSPGALEWTPDWIRAYDELGVSEVIFTCLAADLAQFRAMVRPVVETVRGAI